MNEESFEKWWNGENLIGIIEPELAEHIWNTSREALCVSLPKPFGSSLMCNDFLTYEEVIEALDKAGVKYK